MALWLMLGDPYAAETAVKASQRELAELAGLKVETVAKYLLALEQFGAITRMRKHPRGRVQGYRLHHHPGAPAMARPSLGLAPPQSPPKPPPTSQSSKPRPKPRPSSGVQRSDIAAVLESLPGVRSNLTYSGRGAWQVDDAIAAMSEAEWSLADLRVVCRAYAEDPREGKCAAAKLFSGGARRREAIERYGPAGPTGEPAPAPAEPVPDSPAMPTLAELGVPHEHAPTNTLLALFATKEDDA